MIYGIGTDLIRVQRLRDSVDKFGDRFAQRILLPQELELYPQRRDKARFLAMRFAGKEAVAKALGTGFAHGIWVRDIGIVHDDWGKPEVVFSERGAKRCAQLGVGHCLISLSDEGGFAIAYALAMTRGAHSLG
jgi:holo-[acyl-carrier protein] synthase